jgi:putative tryptophan/tyrosine transport system substrate-binding protein
LLPGLAAELVQLKVDALLVGSCEAQFDAARHATSDIPIIVSACNDDLVANGVVGSLAHPGGNITGLSKITPELTAKRLEILQQLVPTATQIAVLWNSQVSASAQDWKELQSAAKLLKLDLYSIEATGPTDFAAAFKRAADLHVDAMITFSDGMTFQYAKDIASFALKYRMPVISPFREAPLAGALISYGPSLYDMSRLSARYVVKVLKGEKPADIPIEQATRFEMVLNTATASALGLQVPASILARVDELVE